MRQSLPWLAVIVTSSAVLTGCSPDSVPGPAETPGFPEPGIELSRIPAGQALPFTPLPASAACVAGGGAEQLLLPTGYVPTLVATEGTGFPDLPDMITVNETGPNRGQFLYRTHEVGSDGAVSVTDLATGITSIVAQRSDWERFDGIAWTPWGTLVAAEEASPSSLKDPTQPASVGGHVYEIDPLSGASWVREAVGARSHEGMRFDRRGNLYGISETTPGYIYRFVPDHRNDLSSGKLYALKIVTDLGGQTGWAEWVLLDGAASAINSITEAAAKGAAGYGRPEDIEIGTSTGDDRRGNDMLFVAITSENRVIAINLRSGQGDQVFVSDYVKNGVNAPADFTAPDNLALDEAGNLYITEDPGGTAATGKTLGDDVWFAPFNPASGAVSLPAERFLSVTDCDAEPTGVYLSVSNRTLFVNVQHRGGSDPRDQTWAIRKISNTSFLHSAR